jgi:hypothetical protein
MANDLGIRHGFFAGDKTPSPTITESSVRANELPKIDSLRGAAAKAEAVRPSGSNAESVKVLNALYANLSKAIQPQNAPASSAVASEKDKPSFAF